MSVDVLPTRAATAATAAAQAPALLYRPRFPTAELLFAVRDWVPAQGAWEGSEGPVTRFRYAPGAVQIQRRNYARREMSAERQEPWAEDRMFMGDLIRTSEKLGARVGRVGMLAAYYAKHDGEKCGMGGCSGRGHFPPKPAPRQEITEWSRKSRNNFTQAMCQIDYVGGVPRRQRKHVDCPPYCRCAGRQLRAAMPLIRPGRAPAMVTLTYPGDWVTVAPTGAHSKRHLAAFFKAYERAWDEPLTCIWKLELQLRGAPHYHLFMVTPSGKARGGEGIGERFKQWLGKTWARIVGHPDPEERRKNERSGTNIRRKEGMRATDPRRVAVYFLKHSMFQAKAYQHIVPPEWQGPGAGPGRFWGYRHLRRLVHGVELAQDDATTLARTIRRWSYAQGTTQQRSVLRTRGGVPRSKYTDVIGLAGAQYAATRPVLARSPSGELRWEDEAVVWASRRRRVRRRVKRMRGGVGWVAVNDGASFAQKLGDYLERRYADRREQLLAEAREDERAERVNAILNRRYRHPT
jgi:hypothetical protein